MCANLSLLKTPCANLTARVSMMSRGRRERPSRQRAFAVRRSPPQRSSSLSSLSLSKRRERERERSHRLSRPPLAFHRRGGCVESEFLPSQGRFQPSPADEGPMAHRGRRRRPAARRRPGLDVDATAGTSPASRAHTVISSDRSRVGLDGATRSSVANALCLSAEGFWAMVLSFSSPQCCALRRLVRFLLANSV